MLTLITIHPKSTIIYYSSNVAKYMHCQAKYSNIVVNCMHMSVS